MKVVLGPGLPGILLHEAIGHGLEGDFNRKKTSAFHNLMNQKVAREDITIVMTGQLQIEEVHLQLMMKELQRQEQY